MKNESGSQFRAYVRAHYRGEMKLAEFLKLVTPTLHPMATALRRRWTPSAAFDVEDVVQEMLIAVVWALDRYRKRWDESTPKADRPANFMKGKQADVALYVGWNMHDKAKKRLHKERGANLHGNADKNKSRIPRFFDDVARPKMGDEKPRPIESLSKAMVVPPTQHVLAENNASWECIFRQAKSGDLRWALTALKLSQGRKDLAASAIYGDVKLRLQLRLGCEEDAKKIVELAWNELSAA